MTCIIGFTKNKEVFIGGDSAGTSGSDLRTRKDSKVFIKKDMIFGFTSSFRMGQIIEYDFIIPKQPENKNDFEYLCSDFISELRKTLKEKGFATIKENEESGGNFLLGYKGNLYQVHKDFQISQITEIFDACGCGENYALGAMAILNKDNQISPEEKIKKALEIAENFSTGVRSPFTILSLKGV